MRSRIRNLTTVIGALALLSLPALAAANPGRGGAGHHRGRSEALARALSRLELTDAQETSIHQILSSERDAAWELRRQLRAEAKAFNATTSPGTFDEPAFRAHFEKQSKVREELAVLGAKTRAEVFAQLSPEQQTELGKMKAGRSGRFDGRRGAGDGPRRGAR